jgi:glycosyltransferase involved in cell wall biosynthesis
MRVAYLNQDAGVRSGGKKGAAVHVQAMQTALAAQGAQVVAIEESDDSRALGKLQELHCSGRIDLIYERYSLSATAGACFASQSNVPLVLEVNAPLIDEAVEHRERAGADGDLERERRAFASARHILAVSRPVAQYVARHGIEDSRIRVRANGVDLQRFRPRPASSPLLRRKLGIGDAFVLGFHGRLRPWHGFPNLVAIVERLLLRGQPVHLLAIGDGPYEEALRDRIAPEACTVLPWIPHEEVAPYVALFDALALTYPPGAPCYFSPLKLHEAMACGAVPIVPRAGDLAELVQDGHDGRVYDCGDWSELADAIKELIEDRQGWTALSQRAIATAREHSWDALAAEVLDWIREEPAR